MARVNSRMRIVAAAALVLSGLSCSAFGEITFLAGSSGVITHDINGQGNLPGDPANRVRLLSAALPPGDLLRIPKTDQAFFQLGSGTLTNGASTISSIAKAGLAHLTNPTTATFTLTPDTFVSQTDTTGLHNNASLLRIDVDFTWQANNNNGTNGFGAIANGYSSFTVGGVIAPGGSANVRYNLNFVDPLNGNAALRAPFSLLGGESFVGASFVKTYTSQLGLSVPGQKLLSGQRIRVFGFIEIRADNAEGPVNMGVSDVDVGGAPPTKTFTGLSPVQDWSFPDNWLELQPPNSPGDRARFLTAQPGHEFIFISEPITIGTLDIDSATDYNFIGNSPLTFNTVEGPAVVQIRNINGNASHAINGPVVVQQDTRLINDSSGPLVFNSVISGSGSIRKSGQGTVLFNAPATFTGPLHVDEGTLGLGVSQQFSAINMGAGTLNVLPPGDKVLQTFALNFQASGGRIDLNDNDMIVQASGFDAQLVLQQVTGLIGTGSNGGLWNGPGITSSTAAADPTRLTGLAVIRNDDGSGIPFYFSFDGLPVDSNSILIKYTWNGDTDLSGVVDADDYFRIDNGFSSGLTGYFNGDFDYSGSVDADDYFHIDSSFAGQTGPLAASAVAVPEPGALAGLLLAALPLCRRRRLRS